MIKTTDIFNRGARSSRVLERGGYRQIITSSLKTNRYLDPRRPLHFRYGLFQLRHRPLRLLHFARRRRHLRAWRRVSLRRRPEEGVLSGARGGRLYLLPGNGEGVDHVHQRLSITCLRGGTRNFFTSSYALGSCNLG